MYAQVASSLRVIATLHATAPTCSAASSPRASYLPHTLSSPPGFDVVAACATWSPVSPVRSNKGGFTYPWQPTRLNGWNGTCQQHDILSGYALLYLLTRYWAFCSWQGLQLWKAQCRVPDACEASHHKQSLSWMGFFHRPLPQSDLHTMAAYNLAQVCCCCCPDQTWQSGLLN